MDNKCKTNCKSVFHLGPKLTDTVCMNFSDGPIYETLVVSAAEQPNVTNNGQICLRRTQMLLHMSHADNMQSLQPLIQADASPGTLFPAFY